MRTVTSFAVALLSVATLAADALGAQVQVSYLLGGRVVASDRRPGFREDRKEFHESDTTVMPITPGTTNARVGTRKKIIDSAVSGGALGVLSMNSEAEAQIGHLKVLASGSASGKNTDFIDVGAADGQVVRASASWIDTLKIFAPTLPHGTEIGVDFELEFLAGASAEVEGGPVEGQRDARALARMIWFPLGFSVPDPMGGELVRAFANLRGTQKDDPDAEHFSREFEVRVRNGEPTQFGAGLTAEGEAHATSRDETGGAMNTGEVKSGFVAAAFESLTWGGITRVTNAETGEEITDWRVSSESGFDYSRPFDAGGGAEPTATVTAVPPTRTPTAPPTATQTTPPTLTPTATRTAPPTRTATEVGPPTDKDECKKGGWQKFNSPRRFKNQGDCIQFVNTGK